MTYKNLTKGIISCMGITLAAAVYLGTVDSLHVNLPAGSRRKRVACVGDSITYGCFVSGQPWNCYPRQLARMLGGEYSVGNYGYTNRTAINTADHPYTRERLYSESLRFRPDIVLIMLGTNDTKLCNWDPAAYKNDMINLIDSYLAANDDAVVKILLPPPVYPKWKTVMWDIRPEILENEVIPICREIAGEKSLQLIDTHRPLENNPQLFVDGVHPTAKGAKKLAETVYEAIR